MSELKTYNVECLDCGNVFRPEAKSPLWWAAKQRAEAGWLDALRVRGEECGCKEKEKVCTLPYRVFGYDMECRDYDIPCPTFAIAVKTFAEFQRMGDVVFIQGVSDAVLQKLKYTF